MTWLNNLFFQQSIANGILVMALVITIGIWLSRIKIAGISAGITWILFAGIAAGHFGFSLPTQTLNSVKELGLILFVCTIGLQVGPSFFSLFKSSGTKLNLLAIIIVFTGVATTLALKFALNMPIESIVGIMSGAVTNTPALGAATQTFFDLKQTDAPSIALGYAAAYPMGVVGVISTMIFLKGIFAGLKSLSTGRNVGKETSRVSIEVNNEAIFNKTIEEIHNMLPEKHFVVSRICKSNETIPEPASPEMKLNKGDKILLISRCEDLPLLTAFVGKKIDFEWRKIDTQIEGAKFMVSNRKLEGKTLIQLGLYGGAAFNVTRITRASVELVAHADFKLQIGDKLTVVGTKEAIKRVEKIVGNSITKLDHPNLLPIFLGIVFGVILGSVPISLPFIPQPVKLGLAGGPLVVSILIGYFGPRFKLTTYSTTSANLMVRELGISLFLAAVGISAGKEFFNTVFSANGLEWVLIGCAITLVPSITAMLVGRYLLKLDYSTTIGVISGACTNPPALAYANSTSADDTPAASYATVYPLSMFLRVLTAQLLILLFV